MLDEGGGQLVVFEEDRVEHRGTGSHQDTGPSVPQPFVDDVREGIGERRDRDDGGHVDAGGSSVRGHARNLADAREFSYQVIEVLLTRSIAGATGVWHDVRRARI